ncbi:site-specific integrase [Pectobacterium sp. A5351]|uniref:site-specific integrase n=1 Tax=Pectobacterium sp. A5351 TaxID=2914983 RepID=UPI00232E3D59|nr:site-specific integrase [Pectobacterium sp. A5351]
MNMKNIFLKVENKELYQAKTDGYCFSLSDDKWELSRGNTIDIKSTMSLLNDETKDGYIKTMAYMACEYSPSFVKLLNRTFCIFINKTGKEYVDKAGVMRFKVAPGLGVNDLSYIRVLFNKWYSLGYYGISEEVHEIINSWTIPGNKKGEVVKRRDPEQGPLTDNELQGFNEAAMRAYEKNLISLPQLTMSLLVSYTGRRPLQISQMKLEDIISSESEDGEKSYVINIPRIKQGYGFRKEFRSFRVKSEIYNLLCEQANLSVGIISEAIGRDLTKSEINSTPLFVSEDKIGEYIQAGNISGIFVSDKTHESVSMFTNTVKNIVKIENVISERTGRKLNINSRRFRYTLGTRVAREGYGEIMIGELLDHSTLTYTGIYVQYNADHVRKIDNAVSDEMAKYSGIFQGKIDVKDNHQDPSQNIRDFDGEKTGSCQQNSSCWANVPIPCYTCMHFRPLLNAPHQKIYDQLRAERVRIANITGDDRITEVLDRTIYAVAEVIRQCEKINNEKSGEVGV